VQQRLINRTRQGDLGEGSAVDWFLRQGAVVALPLGYSPDYDVIVDLDGRLARVQVKTSVVQRPTSAGDVRYRVFIATMGGNRSWNGLVKRFDSSRFDLLFALCGNGRRWLIPSNRIDAQRVIALGGSKYSEFEIQATEPIDPLVNSSVEHPLTIGTHLECPARGSTEAVKRDAL
jgi:hypothetical protein